VGDLSDIKHVVILMQENRSFDEYFGTFPGATGFSDSTAGGIFNQPGFSASPGGLTPYRMSTFTASGLQRPGHGHDWTAMRITTMVK
jgi:phospholipase C